MLSGLSILLWFSVCMFGDATSRRGQEEIPLVLGAIPAPISRPAAISPTWDVLGPFQIGTRETLWGADPLERLGGFRALESHHESKFPSSLAAKGFVGWSSCQAEPHYPDDGSARVTLLIGFPNVGWDLLKLAWGWSALEFQAWARGHVHVDTNDTQSFEVFTEGILEFWLDDVHYFGGDFFGYSRAPVVVHLQPGSHRIDIRVVRDVRAMGGVGEPNVQISLKFRAVVSGLVVDHGNILAPDIVDGRAASAIASVPVRNTGRQNLRVTRLSSQNNFWRLSSVQNLPLEIAPGQTRPLALRIIPLGTLNIELSVRVEYQFRNQNESFETTAHHNLTRRSQSEPHKFTYLRQGGIVSFALIRPPPISLTASSEAVSLPVVVFLHGAGVDADGSQNSHTLDAISDQPAWTIFASGVTSWSGDDWHQWGWPDVEAAIASIPTWIADVQWEGPNADVNKWLITGHSNGGQGVWYGLTHKPDKIIAAAPVAGYLSIEKYVPYSFWRETDPRRMAVLYAAMNSYRHELLISNAKGVPIMQQHGDLDDNVPCYHSRRMSQLINESGWNSGYNEMYGKGHYFEGIMTTEELLRFYSKMLKPENENGPKSFNFTLVTANPADTGSKFGIQIEQLLDPGQLGKIETRLRDKEAALITSNVRTLGVDLTLREYQRIFIDGQSVFTAQTPHEYRMAFFLEPNGTWRIASASNSPTVDERTGNQLGNLDAILRTKGCFVIENHHESTTPVALQIARNLFQYFAADSHVIESAEDNKKHSADGNLITVGVGANVSPGVLESHPIRLSASTLSIRDYAGHEIDFTAQEHGLAAIFLRPLEGERLELVVWGTDAVTAGTAARLVPLTTGAGQPDFIVLSSESLWRGIDGALAMGFFDSSWNVTRSSFVL